MPSDSDLNPEEGVISNSDPNLDSRQGHEGHRRHHHSYQNPTPIPKKDKKKSCGHHLKGCLLLFPLFGYHFVCFFITFAMGIGMGVMIAQLYDLIWKDPTLDPFWQTYTTLVTMFILVELYFRLTVKTRLTTWMDKIIGNHRIELVFVPRIVYLTMYVASIVLLYVAYVDRHFNDIEGKISNRTHSNPFHMELEPEPPMYPMLFYICICFMVYVLSKENDWNRHRIFAIRIDGSDPVGKGSIGNFLVLLGLHILLVILYGLPIVGLVFLMLKFEIPPGVTYFTVTILAAVIGVAGSFLERQSPFPRTPLRPPTYAFENHLRIRLLIYQYWLLPLTAGRYFITSDHQYYKISQFKTDISNFLVFTVYVSVGITQACKIIANTIFMLWDEYCSPEDVVEASSSGALTPVGPPPPTTKPPEDNVLGGSSGDTLGGTGSGSVVDHAPPPKELQNSGSSVGALSLHPPPGNPPKVVLSESEWPSEISLSSGQPQPTAAGSQGTVAGSGSPSTTGPPQGEKSDIFNELG